MTVRNGMVGLVLGVFLVAFLLWLILPHGLPRGASGTGDFIQYWSAFQLLEQGGNPYDGYAMHRVQANVGRWSEETIMMWNPPWLVMLLWPILQFPFEVAALLWLILHIAFLFLIACFAPVALKRGSPPLIIRGAAVVCFYPVIECLSWGQISIALATAVFGFLYFESRQRYWLSGVCLIPLTVKPHLFFTLAIPGLFWLINLSRGARREFVIAALAGLGVLVLVSYLRWPHSLEWWIRSLMYGSSVPGVIPIDSWQTATLATVLRKLLSNSQSGVPTWPMWGVPLATAAIISVFFLRRGGPIDWARVAPPILCLGLLTTSYGWLFDQSVLVIAQCAAVCDAWAIIDRGRRRVAFGLIILIQILALVVGMQPGHAQHHFTWLPLALVIELWVIQKIVSSQTQGDRATS